MQHEFCRTFIIPNQISIEHLMKQLFSFVQYAYKIDLLYPHVSLNGLSVL